MRLTPTLEGTYRDGELQVVGYVPIGVLAAYELWKDFEQHARLDGRTAPLTGSMAELMGPRLDDIVLDAPVGDDLLEECAICTKPHRPPVQPK